MSDEIGAPHPISNIRPIRLHIPERETDLHKVIRDFFCTNVLKNLTLNDTNALDFQEISTFKRRNSNLES